MSSKTLLTICIWIAPHLFFEARASPRAKAAQIPADAALDGSVALPPSAGPDQMETASDFFGEGFDETFSPAVWLAEAELIAVST